MAPRIRNRSFGIGTYIAWRARFSARASGAIVARHWQRFLLGGLCVPGLPIVSIFHGPALLFAKLLSQASPFSTRLMLLVGFQLGGVLWLLPLRRILHGGDFRAFAATLPLSLLTRCGVSATLLLLIDGLPFMPIGGETMIDIAEGYHGVWCDLLVSAVFLATILCMQIGVLEKLAFPAIGVLLADPILAASFGTPRDGLSAILALLALGLLFVSFRFALRGEQIRGWFLYVRRSWGGTDRLSALQPVLRLQLKALLERPFVLAVDCFTVVAIPVGCRALAPAFSYDARTPIAVIVGMGAVALRLNRSYEVLKAAHEAAGRLTATLPVPVRFWAGRDIRLMTGIGAGSLPLFLWPLSSHRLVSMVAIGLTSIGYLVLIGVLRPILEIGVRFRLMVSLGLVMAWVGTAIACVGR